MNSVEKSITGNGRDTQATFPLCGLTSLRMEVPLNTPRKCAISSEAIPEGSACRCGRIRLCDAAGLPRTNGETSNCVVLPLRTVLPTALCRRNECVGDPDARRSRCRDRSVAIRHAARIKSLANVEKRSRGQLLGLKRTAMFDRKSKEEADFIEWSHKPDNSAKEVQSLLNELDVFYQDLSNVASYELPMQSLRTSCQCMGVAFQLVDAASERSKADLERETPYMDRNFDLTRQQLLLTVNDIHSPTDQIVYREFVRRLSQVKSVKPDVINQIPGVTAADTVTAAETDDVAKLFEGTQVTNPEFVQKCLACHRMNSKPSTTRS